MLNDTYGFVVSKPLQLITALNIASQIDLKINKKILIINNFFAAHEVYEEIRKKYFKSTTFEYFENHDAAYKNLRNGKYRKIFIDSDVGGKKFIILLFHKILNIRKKIVLFEEGSATYESNLDGYGKYFKYLQLIGVGTHFGGSIFIDQVYLYKPEFYFEKFKKNKLKYVKIESTLPNFINQNLNLFLDIFKFDNESLLKRLESGDNCTLYLTEWKVDYELIAALVECENLIVKPHPSILENKVYEKFNCEVVSAGVPAEILIQCLSTKFKKINIHHHGSSVQNYIYGEKYNYIAHEMLSF